MKVTRLHFGIVTDFQNRFVHEIVVILPDANHHATLFDVEPVPLVPMTMLRALRVRMDFNTVQFQRRVRDNLHCLSPDFSGFLHGGFVLC